MIEFFYHFMYFFYCVLFSVILSCVRLSHFIKENLLVVDMLVYVSVKACMCLCVVDEHSENIHQCIVAYLSDAFLLSSSLLHVPFNEFYPSVLLSLDHTVWFHSQFLRTDDWMLYECESPRMSTHTTLSYLLILYTCQNLLLTFECSFK